VLARAVREVEAGIRGGRVGPATRTKFQAVALLLRDERARVRAEETSSETHRAEQLKRLDGVATILARPPCAIRRCWRCSVRTPSSPPTPGRSSRS
jgi:hypothetical protein